MLTCEIRYAESITGNLDVLAKKLYRTYKNQQKTAVGVVRICDNPQETRSWMRNFTTKYVLVDTEQNLTLNTTPSYQMVDTEQYFDILNTLNTENKEHLLAHKLDWLVNVNYFSNNTLRHHNKLSIIPIDIDTHRNGLYGVYEAHNILHYLVTINNFEDMVNLMDYTNILPSNYSLQELVELEYLSKDEHVSWLGSAGTKIHAVHAYFRVDPINSSLHYYRLDTWCGGNPWSAQEHSPRPVYPNTENCTCLKCKKLINNMYKDLGIIRKPIITD